MDTDGYNNGHYRAYQQSSDTVDQVGQIVMLYDGAINFIKQAKEAILDKDFEKRYNLINKAIAIVTGLNSCLNETEETRETVKALDDFYSMIDMRLLYIQCDDNIESCDKVVEDLRVMREAWADVAKQAAEARIAKEAAEIRNSSAFSSETVIENVSMQAGDIDGSQQAELQITA